MQIAGSVWFMLTRTKATRHMNLESWLDEAH
jgi:hypothetical protein